MTRFKKNSEIKQMLWIQLSILVIFATIFWFTTTWGVPVVLIGLFTILSIFMIRMRKEYVGATNKDVLVYMKYNFIISSMFVISSINLPLPGNFAPYLITVILIGIVFFISIINLLENWNLVLFTKKKRKVYWVWFVVCHAVMVGTILLIHLFKIRGN